MSRRGRRTLGLKFPLTALSLLLAAQAFAGATPTAQPHVFQGSGASNANGEYLMSDMGGPARFFIEVTPGVTRLRVDIWDADIGLGGGGEATSPGRDRSRGGGFSTTATFTLTDPAGTVRPTLFTTGTNAAPALSDNAWTTLFDTSNSNVADNFNTSAYNNNNGSVNWTTNWAEAGEGVGGGGAGAGFIQVIGGQLRMQDALVALTDTSLNRQANLASVSQATFSFDVSTSNNLENTDQLLIQVSDNGGGAYTTIDTLSGNVSGPRSYDISAFTTNNTRVRFVVIGPTALENEFFFIDNVNIAGSIMAGHWEVSMNQTGGDDINAFGVRASDGDVTSAGTELNVYYDSIGGYGVNPPGSGSTTRAYTQYPYITSGCTVSKNDFDWDSDSGTVGSIVLTAKAPFLAGNPATPFTQTFATGTMSDDSNWVRNATGNITSDQIAAGYGIWTGNVNIITYINGAGQNGNYGHVYFSKPTAPANPPAVNPLANNQAFRVYLPTDNNGAPGNAPVEPYLEQEIRYSGSGGTNGPNPPQNNTESIYTVTVRMVNPTSGPITFSNTNLVTANVPGAGTVYKNPPAAQVSQGTVVSQPANNGTGNITWNPGTIAAGANAVLAYRVGITTTNAIPRRVATGANANGTRATYVDQTGNTTQGRATYTFGPLCELAITQASLTPVVVSRVQTKQSGEGVVVEFETASEVGAAGFDVYRWIPATKKWLKINDTLIPALINSPQGGRYQVKDAGASTGSKYWYSVREVELDGSDKAYGPFESTAAVDNGPAVAPGNKGGRPRVPTAALLEASAASEANAAIAKVKAAKVVTPALKIGVKHTGLVLLPTQTIADHFGMSLAAAQDALTAGRFDLTTRGGRVAWFPASGGRGLLFFGEELDSPYDTDNVYWLRSAKGLIATPVATGAPVAAEGGAFKGSVHAEIDALPALVVTTNPDSDYWFWDYLNASDAGLSTKNFTLDVPYLAQGLATNLTVHLSSATTSGLKKEHSVIVRVNGTQVGSAVWAGIKAQSIKATLGEGLLHEGANTVQLQAVLGNGVPTSIVYLDSFDLEYARAFKATDDALSFRGEGASNVSIGGFADDHILVLDVTKPRQPRVLSNVLVDQADGHGRVSIAPATAATPYYAVSEAGWLAPDWTAGDQPSNLAKAAKADYVVITTAELLEPAQRLANIRSSDGLTTLVADIQDVYDEFSEGMRDPRAIGTFLKTVTKKWGAPPRFVVLAGRGNYDYKNLGGLGGNLVPPLMVSTPKGLFASDTALGDVGEKDGVPEIAVGRIPVLSAEEFDAYVDKVQAYETAPAPETARKAVMVADAPDGGVDFSQASDAIAAGLPSGYLAENVRLQTDVDVATPRAEFFNLLDDGAALVNYTGHGALDRLSGEGLLTSADVPTLHNTQTPILSALSCTINRFEVPGFAPLGEELVKAPGVGFVASWAPTGLSVHNEATLLGEAFYRDLGNHPGSRLGDAVNNAYRSFIALGGQAWMPNIYGVLGDPALRLKEGVEDDTPPQGPPNPVQE